jgi:chromosome segregation protein
VTFPLLLKSIEIQGFKSFADKTVLHFGKGITAVVGPNGSGKSNISDAVRWVLGEQSSKTLRGLKMEDVVFGGTAARKRMGFAEVTLTIDNIDRHIPCDTDEVAVTRRYYRSGESEYRINNASVRLRDVHELFMDTGLGRDGYSMVGQGKIDDIVGTKTSSERRDIFEEAAGISRYRYRKLEAERKLTQAEDNLVRLRDILSELENRVGPLAEQSKKAEKFLEYSKEQENLQIGVWLHSLAKYKDLLRDQDYKITAARAQYDEIIAFTSDIESRIETMSDRSQKLIISADESRRTAAEYEENAARVDGDIAVHKNTIFHNGETIVRIEREIESLNDGDGKITAEIEQKTAQIAEKNEQIKGFEAQLADVQSELMNLISESDSFSQQIEQLNHRLNELSSASADERVNMMTARSTLDEILLRQSNVDELIAQKEQESTELNEELSSLSRDLSHCDDTIGECTNALKGQEMLLASRRSKCEQIKSEIDALTLDEGEKRRRAQILDDLERNMEGFAHSVKMVMQASNRGELRGIHGTVGRIIQVDEKYSTAIEAALGASVQHIIVSGEDDAKRAINHLKNNKGGRATFLPITSIKPRNFSERGLDDCIGFVGIAAKLVKCEEKYNNILSSLLGGIAVAEDLDCAVSIAKKYSYRFKIVTLDGQIVNAGGSMTGGSTAKNAGILSRTGEITALRDAADKIAAKIADANEKYKRANGELAELEADILNAKSELATSQEDKIRVLGEIRRVTEQRDAAERDKNALISERDTAKMRSAELNTAIESAQTALTAFSEQSKALEAELSSITGGRDRTSARREELGNRSSEIRTFIFAAKKDVDVLTDSIAELNQRVSGQSDRVAELTAEIESIKQQNQQIEEKIAELTAAAEVLRKQSSETTAQISLFNDQRDELEKKIIELRQSEKDKSSDREKLSGELVRLEERRNAMVRDYDETIRKLYDEYGLTRSEAEEKNIIIEDIAAAGKRLNELKNKIRLLGSVNVAAIEEYKEVSERYKFMSEQISDVENSRDELLKLINQLTDQMQTLFVDRFSAINAYFSKIFVELFGGGTAELKLTDPDNVLESGIEIIVQPPGKNISIIEQLSGGEKALIAISIYFAVMKVNPPPFCVLDEVDAALDDANVVRFADYLRRMSDGTQFIVITHRRGTMEEADMLYGVTMQEKGISKLLELNVAEMERQMKLEQA